MDFKCTGRLPHISNNYLYDILLERGIDNPSDYLNVDKTSITPFDTLDNIIEAGNKLIEVINNVDNPNILITVDSDVDGYTSAAIMYSYLKQSIKKEITLHYLIHDGKQHGIDDLLEQIKDLLPDILIIPDASSSELEEHKIISKICPIIVLDHHQSDVVNDEYAIRVNNQLSENFSNKTLCGAGIVYKFCQCLDNLLNINNADNYLDLVAVALVADMMDLRNPETHYLVKTGLKNIKNSGLKAFVNAMGYSLSGRTELVPVDVAFYIAPYINEVIILLIIFSAVKSLQASPMNSSKFAPIFVLYQSSTIDFILHNAICLIIASYCDLLMSLLCTSNLSSPSSVIAKSNIVTTYLIIISFYF